MFVGGCVSVMFVGGCVSVKFVGGCVSGVCTRLWACCLLLCFLTCNLQLTHFGLNTGTR